MVERDTPPGVVVETLFEGEETLFGRKPSEICGLVLNKLSEYDRRGKEVLSITAIPDYHHWGEDGGVKNILFLTRPAVIRGLLSPWMGQMLVNDYETMYAKGTGKIVDKLRMVIGDLESRGYTVVFTVAITDSHRWATASGIGGLDGLKNMLIFCRQIA